MQAALRQMHEERLERFEDFRDANDRSSAGDDTSSPAKNDASSLQDSFAPNSSATKGNSPAPDAASFTAGSEQNEKSSLDDASSISNDASNAGGAEWMAEARDEALRRKSDRSTGRKSLDAKSSETRGTVLDHRRAELPLAATGPAKNEGSDEALFLRYQQGDDRAFFTIYERYKSSIYAYCARVLFSAGLSRETVEDTFQDVFLRLVQYRDTFTGGDFQPWIFTVTRHSCLSVKRSSFRKRARMDYIGDGINFEEGIAQEIRHAFSITDDPLERMSSEEQTGLLLAAISRLPEEHREALLLSEYEGMTYDEIGRMLGASLSTVRIRIFRAKAGLRKMLLPVIGDASGTISGKSNKKKV